MKRISRIRRRRYIRRAVVLGFAIAALAPAAALADPQPLDRIADATATGGVTAGEYGIPRALPSDYTARVSSGEYGIPRALPTDVRNRGSEFVYRRADDFAPPRNVTVPTASTGSTIDWSMIALWSSLGLVGILGALALGVAASRRGTRPAHP